jgi:hypothetical protein
LQDGSYNGHLLCSKWSQLNVEITIVDIGRLAVAFSVIGPLKVKAQDRQEWSAILRKAKAKLKRP